MERQKERRKKANARTSKREKKSRELAGKGREQVASKETICPGLPRMEGWPRTQDFRDEHQHSPRQTGTSWSAQW